MDDWDKLFEENRFFNWYYGYTVITPKWRDGINNPVFEVNSAAPKGMVNTQYFGEEFDQNKFAIKATYVIRIFPPISIRTNSNVTLHLILEKSSSAELRDNYYLDYKQIDAKSEVTKMAFNPPIDISHQCLFSGR